MSLPRTVADVIASHVTLEGEGAVSSHQMKAISDERAGNKFPI
jgi:hypothetical protein